MREAKKETVRRIDQIEIYERATIRYRLGPEQVVDMDVDMVKVEDFTDSMFPESKGWQLLRLSRVPGVILAQRLRA